MTANIVPIAFLKEFGDIDSILTKTIVNALKLKLKMAYKKLGTSQHKMMTQNRIREFLESAMVQLYLDGPEYSTIYLDEFNINSRNMSIYSW